MLRKDVTDNLRSSPAHVVVLSKNGDREDAFMVVSALAAALTRPVEL